MKSNQNSRMSLERKRPELALKLEFLIKGESYFQELGYKNPSHKKDKVRDEIKGWPFSVLHGLPRLGPLGEMATVPQMGESDPGSGSNCHHVSLWMTSYLNTY